MAAHDDPRVDLRSDTVTRPDAEMRRAMAAAEVGDDVFGEDPTVRRLEEEAAEIVGHEAALFMPTGTMGNQVALNVHAPRASEVICEARCHVLNYEMGAMAQLSGLLPRVVHGDAGGRLEPAAVEAAILPDVSYLARSGVVAVENTHNMAGGTVSRPERMAALIDVARRHGLPIHLDGARVFNAAVALGVAPRQLTAGFDSVMFSLSKGLGAPVGSMLCGGADFIAEARRVRKMFGGGMRQVGVLAAAGRVALAVVAAGGGQLAADHENARWLAGELAALRGIELDAATVETNILIFRVTSAFFAGSEPPAGSAAAFVATAAEQDVLAVPISPTEVRLVTHRDVPRPKVERAAAVFRRLAA
jgi:threonine aldolase